MKLQNYYLPLTRSEYDSLCLWKQDYESCKLLCSAYNEKTSEWDPIKVAKAWIAIYKDGNLPPHVPMVGGSLAKKLKVVLHDIMARKKLLPKEILEELEEIEHKKNPKEKILWDEKLMRDTGEIIYYGFLNRKHIASIGKMPSHKYQLLFTEIKGNKIFSSLKEAKDFVSEFYSKFQ